MSDDYLKLCKSIVFSKGMLAEQISGCIYSILLKIQNFIGDIDFFESNIYHLIPLELIMITLDVSSLHISILHIDGINVCCSFIHEHNTGTVLRNDIFIPTDFIVKSNLFKLNTSSGNSLLKQSYLKSME